MPGIGVIINPHAKANKKLADSLTPALVQYQAIQKWDGALPRLNGGGAVPFIDVGKDLAAKPAP